MLSNPRAGIAGTWAAGWLSNGERVSVGLRKVEGTRPVRPVSVATIIHASDSYCRVTCAVAHHTVLCRCHTDGYTSCCPLRNCIRLRSRNEGILPRRGKQTARHMQGRKLLLKASKNYILGYVSGSFLALFLPACRCLVTPRTSWLWSQARRGC